ncbi:MAG TPA: monovalent cation/H(+) antiporter subunit G [Egibacteraceae bacterium]|nr:monovalent cation/H(+) antiporter subunit G [Egibacteraceae bacterium]
MTIGDLVFSIVLLTGVVLGLLAGVGLHRFPDVFARMHAATKPSTLGLVLVVAAVAARLDDSSDTAKLLVVIILQFLTAPVGAHMVARAAHRAGGQMSPDTQVDELSEVRVDTSARGVPPQP